MNEPVAIQSSDFWVKVVEMLQQNWALIEPTGDDAVRAYFISDVSDVFDQMEFASLREAADGLRCNGFRRFADEPQLQSFLRPPAPPFRRSAHPNGAIYSSGRFWR